jgi:hypothetical protein
MSTSHDPAGRSAVNAVARRYLRQGYRVTRPGRGQPVPAFLDGFVPDLIAESDADRVVVEVKRSDLVPGANELTAVAERVAQEPGWRFELVAVQPPSRATARRRRIAEDLLVQAERYLDLDLPGTAVIWLVNAIEEAMLALAEGRDRFAGDKSAARLARDLVTLGIIDAEEGALVRDAGALRQRAVAGDADAAEVRALLRGARGLLAQVERQ